MFRQEELLKDRQALGRQVAAALTALVIGAAAVPAAAPVAAQTVPGAVAPGYIVVLREGAASDATARDHARTYSFDVTHLYSRALNGYAARFDSTVAERLKSDTRVDYVTPDFTVQAPWEPSDSISDSIGTGPIFQIGQRAPRGVSRIGASTDNFTQTLANNGTGVGVAIIDTGIQLNHPDLTPVQNGKNCINPALTAEDDNSHGTHVAGTIGARDNNFGVVGVAPGATLHAVKVLDSGGNGSWAGVICGVEWVTANAESKGIKVANMSLGGFGTVTASNANCTNSNNDALHTAVCNSVKAGVTYVIAAGNSAADASGFVPAGYAEAITVSAWSDTNGKSDAAGNVYTCSGWWGAQTDETWATGTNFGSVVDIGAPGVGIRSTVLDGKYGYKCGTSMAAPHVAGAAALAVKKWPNLTPSDVRTTLRNLASPIVNTVQHTENLVNVSSL